LTGTTGHPLIIALSPYTTLFLSEDIDLSATGTLTSADIDNGATATWSIQGSASGTYGSLALSGNTGQWTYTLANGTNGVSSAVQNRRAHESTTDSYRARVTASNC